MMLRKAFLLPLLAFLILPAVPASADPFARGPARIERGESQEHEEENGRRSDRNAPDFAADVRRFRVDDNYDGPGKETEAFANLKERLTEACEDALRNAWERLGLDLPDDVTIRIELYRDTRRRASAATYRSRSTGLITIRFYVDYWIGDPGRKDPVVTLRHEVIHALQRALMGDDGYEAQPKWLREGLGTYAADQGPPKTHQYRGNLGDLSDLGLRDGDAHRHRDYVADFLAVQFIEDRFEREGGLREFIRLLNDGRPWAEALREVTGMDFPTFEREAMDYAREEIPKIYREEGRYAGSADAPR